MAQSGHLERVGPVTERIYREAVLPYQKIFGTVTLTAHEIAHPKTGRQILLIALQKQREAYRDFLADLDRLLWKKLLNQEMWML